jgi:phosphogluconate dehydratase
MRRLAEEGPRRAHLSCGNQAHAYAAMGGDKDALVAARAPNIGIVTAYNDMLSAHQPFKDYPDRIKEAARKSAPRRRSRAACRPCAMASRKARRGWS